MRVRILVAGLGMGADIEVLALRDRVDSAIGVLQPALLAGKLASVQAHGMRVYEQEEAHNEDLLASPLLVGKAETVKLFNIGEATCHSGYLHYWHSLSLQR